MARMVCTLILKFNTFATGHSTFVILLLCPFLLQNFIVLFAACWIFIENSMLLPAQWTVQTHRHFKLCNCTFFLCASIATSFQPDNTFANFTTIPDICNYFYAHTFPGLKILHTKARKFATKIASRQNSVNQYWRVKFTYIFNFLWKITK